MRDETKCHICNNPLREWNGIYGNNGFPLVPKCDYPLIGKEREGYRICDDCNDFNLHYRIFLNDRRILPMPNLNDYGDDVNFKDVTKEEDEKRDKFNKDLDNLLNDEE